MSATIVDSLREELKQLDGDAASIQEKRSRIEDALYCYDKSVTTGRSNGDGRRLTEKPPALPTTTAAASAAVSADGKHAVNGKHSGKPRARQATAVKLTAAQIIAAARREDTQFGRVCAALAKASNAPMLLENLAIDAGISVDSLRNTVYRVHRPAFQTTPVPGKQRILLWSLKDNVAKALQK